ncbi:COG1361 S-layer family protein [Halorussus sp. AFM4]|uniref:COG1361 S-layer family protein n=1 Tax=Halorussus sp. AFM4 TaxID=3421651 RepID=UPI003EBA3D95
MRTTALALAAAALLAAATVAPAAPALAREEGTVVGRPDLELSATDNRFGAGEQTTLEVFVSNSGDLDRGGPAEYQQRVTTARNVRLEIDQSRMDERLARKVEVETGTVFAGTVPEGVAGPFAFNLEIADSLSPGTYEIPVEVTYDYTNYVEYGPGRAPEYGDASRSTTKYVTVVVEDQPRFEIRAQNLTSVTAGDTTTYRLNLTNTGTRPAVNAQVTLSAATPSLATASCPARTRPTLPRSRTGSRASAPA